MKAYFLSILIILLLFSGAMNYIQYRSAVSQQAYRDQDTERFQAEQKRKLTQISKRDSLISSLLIEREEDSTKYASEQGRLKTKINNLRAKITGPAVVQDTIIVFQDSLIANLENERDTLYLTDNQALDSLQASVKELKGMYAEQYKRAARFQQDYYREKRKRFSLGPHAGWDFNGPSIGISVQYAIFRF